jgi:lipid II:glycine glycyltransferase (peptidoglycan interpeptide bridge formation enzyme)
LSFDEPKKEKYFREFMNLMKITGERDDFKLYEEGYYRAFFRDCPDSRIKKFLIFTKQVSQAEETNYLSVALVVFFDKIANLVFAGSVTEGREKGLNHLMQWEAIKYAKRLGAEVYNFGGIYENGYGRSSLQGVTSFKKKFNGYAKFHGDFLDLPVKKIKYFFYILKKIFT